MRHRGNKTQTMERFIAILSSRVEQKDGSAGSASGQEELGFGTLLRTFQDQIPVSCQKWRTHGFLRAALVDHITNSHI